MKKSFLIILFMFLSLSFVIFTGCKDPEPPHEHTYSDSWTKDATHHWHASTCGHEVTEGKAAHSFGDWTTTKESTEEAEGSREKSCTVCGYKVTEAIEKLAHTHKFASEWTYDKTAHWHAATCGCSDVELQKTEHTFVEWEVIKEATEEETGTREKSCTVCGYKVTEEDIICTADNVAEIITSLKASENPYTIIVTGEISSDTISAIKTALKGNTSVKVNLDLGNTTGLTSIGKDAFWYCSNLSSVVIPESVTSIRSYAFYGCSSLSSVVIPEGVTSIGGGSFSGCSSLENFDVDKNNLNYASSEDGKMLLNKDKTLLLAFPTASGDVTIPEGVTSIGYGAFGGCSNLSSVVIPEGFTSIVSYAFDGCSNLSSVVIPESVTSIGNYAFQDCSNLSSVAIPEGVTSIGMNAFSVCSNLSSVVIPAGVTSIGENAFSVCSNLSSVVIPEGVTSIGKKAFQYCSSLSSVVIPAGVTSIGNYAFLGCSSLSSVVIPESVTSIGDGAFQDCSSLENFDVDKNNLNYASSEDGKMLLNKDKTLLLAFPTASGDVTIPDGVTSIGKNAFSDCISLSSVVIPDGVTSIGENAFSDCIRLSSVVISEGVTSIGNYAFLDCISLSSVTFVDTDTWYYTSNSDYTNGTRVDVTVPSTNASCLRITYRAKYWYKE